MDLTPPPIAFITLAAPALAWGALAAAVPVLIHLMLRQRPRKQILPTLQFLLTSHRSHRRAQRLKHLLLMMCRGGLVVLLALLLARGSCESTSAKSSAGGWVLPDARRPVSALICVDDSASMGYRYRGKTRLEAACDMGLALIEDRERFPEGSELALITGSSRHQAGWTDEPQSLQKLLATLLPGDHNRGVADLLQAAPALFKAARHPVHEVYLLTDLTARAWTPRPGIPELAGCFILDVGESENSNVMLAVPEFPTGGVAADLTSHLPVTIRTGSQSAEPELELEVDGQRRDRQTLGQFPAGAEMSVDLVLPPMTAGLHAISMTLNPADGLTADNRRVLFVSAGSRPVVMVCGSEHGPVGTMISTMIAPPAQAPSMRRFEVRELPSSAVDTAANAKPQAVLLADPGPLTDSAWDRLELYVREGGAVVVIPGPRTAAGDYRAGAKLLPAEIHDIIDVPEGLKLAAADLRAPFLAPFADPGVDSINDREAFRRLEIGRLQPEATVAAPFSDGRPAILQRRIGRGHVLLLAFSPAADWGQFGTQAAPMIVMLHALLESLGPVNDELAAYHAGQAVYKRLKEPNSKAGLTLRERLSGRTEAMDAAGELVALPTERVGLYEIARAGAEEPVERYSVNVAESESDLTRLEPATLGELFPDRVLTVARSLEELRRRNAGAGGAVELWVPVGLGLIGLLIVESFFSNRFYRRPAEAPAAEPRARKTA